MDTFGNTDPDQYGNRKIAIGALHVLKQVLIFCESVAWRAKADFVRQEPSFAHAKCMSNGYLYAMPSDVLQKHLMDASFATV